MENIESRNWLTKEEAEAFVGTNSDYYLYEWEIRANGFYKGWNWAAAIFRLEWMAYRKMYLEAVIALIAAVGVSFAITVFSLLNFDTLGLLIRLLLPISIGAFANILYRNKALRVFRKTGGMGERQRLTYLRGKGGTSLLGLFVLLGLEVALQVVILLID